MEKHKKYLDMIRKHLNDDGLRLDPQKLDELVMGELDKTNGKPDSYLVNLCLDALAAYRISEKKE